MTYPAGKRAGDSATYEDHKARALSTDVAVRTELAASEETEPEILYYLTDDTSGAVRKELAINPCTPSKANLILAEDDSDDVRMELARKICRLLPDLSGEQSALLLDKTIEVLEILAQDQATAVRTIIADALKDSLDAPKNVVMSLARDIEEIVASPILEYSPLLSDADLLEIIAGGIAAGALPAIARRKNLGEEVSDAVVAQLEVPAISALLANPSAKIREDTLDEIMDQAEHVVPLHEPLVMRLNLSLRAMRRIAGFVASSLVETLVERHNLPAATEKELKNIVRRRIDKTTELSANPEESGKSRAEKLFAAGKLDEEAIADAIDAKDPDFVAAALSLLSEYGQKKIESMLASRNGKVVTSLCWKAGLSMRLAFKIQTAIAHVARGDIVNARNGIEYPFTQKEMDWQLSFFDG
ncbi:DUF2336 domain-containing protein [Sneathiella chungangensis]|uniref:DUF2336 domain-containing protein n=1 Tax=Sneathiella chungangensis TaxID=1418234 RepID=A0A845MIN8_9PROT|nr:DUF2336 domain-containing protein [Sneathiella chungangensis]